MSVAIALPLMAATASTQLPDGTAEAHPELEQIAKRSRGHERTEQTTRSDDDHRAVCAEHRDQERKDRQDD
jgi:hypothetical protein